MIRAVLPLAVLGAAAPAAAFEDQLIGDVEAGYAHLAGDLEGPGVSAALGLRHGLTDAWNLAAGLGYSLHPGGELTHVAVAGAGVEWVFDVVQLVPYAALGVEAMLTAAGGEVDPALGAQVGLGADYLLSRALAVGLVVRYHAPLSRLSELPVYLTVDFKLSLTLSD